MPKNSFLENIEEIEKDNYKENGKNLDTKNSKSKNEIINNTSFNNGASDKKSLKLNLSFLIDKSDKKPQLITNQ